MARGKNSVKLKKVLPKGSKEDTELLNTMFEQMTGVQNAERNVIIPKIIKLYFILKKYHKLLSLLLSFTEFRNTFKEYKEWFQEIQEFLDKIENVEFLFLDRTYIELNIDCIKEINEFNDETLNKFYKNLKNDFVIKNIIITSNKLSKFKKYLNDISDLKDVFINREPGLSLKPLNYSNLDLKILWCSEFMKPQIKKYILSILHHIYKMGLELYNIITSPDVDIKKFSSVIIQNISKMKKQIPRCNDAFKVIENAVEMLETNFKSYYKNSIEAENPSVIIENFIIDVSLTQKANSRVTSQFRRIVSHLQKRSASIKDPKIKKLFGMLNNQFSMIDTELKTNSDENSINEENSKDTNTKKN